MPAVGAKDYPCADKVPTGRAGPEAGPSRRYLHPTYTLSKNRLLIVPLFRGSSRFESMILSHNSRRVTCECNEEDINHD